MKRYRILVLLFILVALVLPARAALADTGPKPEMDFEFKGLQDGELQITSGILYECDLSDCSDAAPLEELGPQGLYCDTTSCYALAYGFAPYHILEVEFSDEVTRQSNVFETAGFNSKYSVTIQQNDLLVKPKFGLAAISSYIWFLLSCICCLAVVALIATIVFFVTRRSKQN
jgi:hypothetical protein